MGKTMVRVEKNKNNPYLMLNKTSLNDINLSWKAKGLHAYLLSLPDDWKIYIDDLKNRSTDKKESTASGVNELIKNGYIERNRLHDDSGKFKGYEYVVYEIPVTVEKSTVIGKPVDGKTENGKPATTNKEIELKNKGSKGQPSNMNFDQRTYSQEFLDSFYEY